jgi:hypothetical protein
MVFICIIIYIPVKSDLSHSLSSVESYTYQLKVILAIHNEWLRSLLTGMYMILPDDNEWLRSLLTGMYMILQMTTSG